MMILIVLGQLLYHYYSLCTYVLMSKKRVAVELAYGLLQTAIDIYTNIPYIHEKRLLRVDFLSNLF